MGGLVECWNSLLLDLEAGYKREHMQAKFSVLHTYAVCTFLCVYISLR